MPRLAWFLVLATGTLVHANTREGSNNPPCRFAPLYTEEDIVRDPSQFVRDVLFWDGQFVRPDIGYNHANGMSYDGTLLNQATGVAPAYGSGRHNFSAASKESLHVMLLAQVLAGSKGAARVVSPESQKTAQRKAYEIMNQKLGTYLAFNETFPGFGGLLPWYNNTYAHLSPTNDWVDRLPALDNGELLWAVYAAVEALSVSHDYQYRRLGARWQEWLDYTKTTAAKLFYHGNGRVCAVITLNQTLSPHNPAQNYTCEGDDLLDDPYEGELFTWWLYFFSNDLSSSDRDALWLKKRAKLQATTYQDANIGPITVQKGYWFSSHEQWKVLEMPYSDIPLINQLFTNAEIARTCNSALLKIPGMYASVNNITDDASAEILGYISNAGIPSISFLPDQELDVITPYATFPTFLVDETVGIVWYWAMLLGKKMQNPYGSTESERVDGKAVSSFVSWDSKITTIVALLGGVRDLVREKMRRDGVYDEFLSRIGDEYARVFTDVKSGDGKLCLPTARVRNAGLKDYTSCD
ncbi:hypothetical protein AC578_2453 [Pseudocercospora eumusae]|uniref:Endo-beta-1,2-glucanase SGL domain-containing protein n=1 Tax=Pseudocercospora eumusae TaxID=321146 RepID=A0A139HXQ0_9PEZI|nr:hypothetical protein AC578_2453 [Pseudocercospora eumusae]